MISIVFARSGNLRPVLNVKITAGQVIAIDGGSRDGAIGKGDSVGTSQGKRQVQRNYRYPIVNQIVKEKDADYAITLKENQGRLYEDVVLLFKDLEKSNYTAYAF